MGQGGTEPMEKWEEGMAMLFLGYSGGGHLEDDFFPFQPQDVKYRIRSNKLPERENPPPTLASQPQGQVSRCCDSCQHALLPNPKCTAQG